MFIGWMIKKIFLFFICILVIGCSTKEIEKTAQQLVDDGTVFFNEEDYTKAIASFKKLKDWYPFSKHVAHAELKIADAYFKLEKYSEAIVSYGEFEKLHPKNEKIPYVIYQKGLCHFLQVDTIDRDQRNAQKALKIFKKLLKSFPQSKYAGPATAKLKKCLDSLAGHEFYVGEFYFKSEHYKGALKRFEFIIKIYPDTKYKAEAERYITLCKKNIKDNI